MKNGNSCMIVRDYEEEADMSRKTTAQDIIDLMNRSMVRLIKRKKKASKSGDFLQVHRYQDKIDELGYILGRITANENDIRSITESGD